MLDRSIDKIFEKLKSHLIDQYTGDREVIETIIDISYRRCIHADRDHHRDRRQYMHVGCEEMIICVSSSIDTLDKENLQGLFAHEIGHVIHLQLPEIMENVMEDDELAYIDNMDDDEIVADQIIGRLFGISIHYDSKKVQWMSLE